MSGPFFGVIGDCIPAHTACAQGVRMGARCFWDAKTDTYVEEMYSNESLFAVAVAFGVYFY